MKTIFRKSRLIGTLAAAAALSLAGMGTASAALINFDQVDATSPGGTVTYNGTTLSGSDIGFDVVEVDGTGATDGTYYCTNEDGTVATRCLLSFETGAQTGTLGGTYQFGAGGNVTVSGYLATSVGGTVVSSSPVVVSGSFSTYSFTVFGTHGVGAGGGIDIKDSTFVTYLGLGSGFEFLTSQLAFDSCTGSFTCNVTAADFQNNAVPEPMSLGLFGLGLLGLGLVRRRR